MDWKEKKIAIFIVNKMVRRIVNINEGWWDGGIVMLQYRVIGK